MRAFEEMKPKYFLFENVASMNEESKKIISEYLGCEPILIDSACFSAQIRPRYYWTNIPFEHILPPEFPEVLKDIMQNPAEVDKKYFYNCSFDTPNMEKHICTQLHINGHDIIKRVQNPNFKCHTLTAVCGGNQQKKVLTNGRVRKLTPLEYERLQTLPDKYTEGVSDSARYKAIGNGWTVNVIAYIFEGLKGTET